MVSEPGDAGSVANGDSANSVDSLEFSMATREWFTTSFGAPTRAQSESWGPISRGESTLLCAPTGSGKTLAAFLWAIDELGARPRSTEQVRVLYISPLRALAVDVEKNLRSPIKGVAIAAQRLGVEFNEPTVGVRTGDTTATERRGLARHPPDILITTPESLYLMLTSAARETLASVECIIIDEIHALAKTKRGAHLSLSLERLEHLIATSGGDSPQRIGLSATQRPLETIARFLGGSRPVTIVDAGITKELDISVRVPVDELGAPNTSVWPDMDAELLDLVEQHRSTLIFVNARRTAERLAGRLNELEGKTESLVMAHHGSLSRERRLVIEDRLKRGDLRGLVATSSLELGIDMGAVDLVIQVESPGSVSSGLQRIGRAGHQVGAPSVGRIFPKHRADLVEAAVVAQRMHEGLVEVTRLPVNPLDVLAQQIVAACALDEWDVDDLFEMCRGSANFSSLSRALFDNTLDMLAGRYPSDEFAELRPRVVWDRIEGKVRGRAGAQRLAVTSGGTIPDRGLFGVFLPDGTRVGELDEEMVYETRVGETFLLGASTWRVEEITFERVVVTPAPGQPGRMPFWRGDGPGREAELGRAVGEFIRKIRSLDRSEAESLLGERYSLDEQASANVVSFLDEQAESTGAVPDDLTIVVERFRDEIGDWRICIHSPYGARVHAPWATVVRARVDEHFANLSDGAIAEVLWSDDGIVIRLPESAGDLPLEVVVPDPDEMEPELIAALPGTSVFASHFREAAARALLLPRRRPDQRTPLWQQRQRAADLLGVASKYPSFPILLEATRECCNDLFDLPALRQLLTEVRSRRVRIVQVETSTPSPFARSLLFGWIAVYMYEGDAPLAERRAAALTLDSELLGDLLGTEELRSLLDPEAVAITELELQRLTEDRGARDADEVHDLLRVLGPLTRDEICARIRNGRDVDGSSESLTSVWVDELNRAHRVIDATIAGDAYIAAAEDAGRLRDALGVAVPLGLPAVFTEPTYGAFTQLVERYARTHGPFTSRAVALRFGVGVDVVDSALRALVDAGRVIPGEFTPGGIDPEWCDVDVLRRIRRRSLAALRKEIEPVDERALTLFSAQWQGVGSKHRGIDALADVIARLQGAAIPASTLEPDVLGLRVGDYNPADLDALCSSGEVVWIGAGAVGASDGRIRLAFRDQVRLIVERPEVPASAVEGIEAAVAAGPAPALTADVSVDVDQAELIRASIRKHLAQNGAAFWPDILQALVDAGVNHDQTSVLDALWDLVWAGEVTGDSLIALRAFVAGGSKRSASGARSRRSPNRGSLRRSRIAHIGPPAGAGRWSLTAPLFGSTPSQTERTAATAEQLLERYGVLTREMALAEGIEGGFAGVYPVLKVMEERGRVRRGYFVEGLGAAQFAQPGAVDALRSFGETSADRVDRRLAPTAFVLSATDTAQLYGAALRWPESVGQPSRSIGAYVVIIDGNACAYLERGGRRILTFPDAETHPTWPLALEELVDSGRVRRLQIATIDGVPVMETRWVAEFQAAGFVDGYRGMTRG